MFGKSIEISFWDGINGSGYVEGTTIDVKNIYKGQENITEKNYTFVLPNAGNENGYVTEWGIVAFKEDVHEGQVAFVSPKRYAQLRKDPAWITVNNGEKFMNGQVGEIMGCSIVVSNSIPDNKVLVVRAGALGLELKRDLMMEMDRDIIHKTTIITVDKHYITYLKDASKVIRITVKG